MNQMGHKSSALALEVYAKVMERADRGTGAAMDALVRGPTWAEMGRNDPGTLEAGSPLATKNPD